MGDHEVLDLRHAFSWSIVDLLIRKSLLEINWIGLTNLLDIPGLNGLSKTIIWI